MCKTCHLMSFSFPTQTFLSLFPGAKGSFKVKAGLAQMLKGGVIMDVVNVEQAKVGMCPLMSWCWVCPLQHVLLFHPMQIAEAAGAVAVMALERIPADIRYDGGVARMSDPAMIREIKAAVTIPVMAKVRWGEEEHALTVL